MASCKKQLANILSKVILAIAVCLIGVLAIPVCMFLLLVKIGVQLQLVIVLVGDVYRLRMGSSFFQKFKER